MTNIDPAIVDALADALHADTDICGGGCTQPAKRLAPALAPAVDATLTAALAELDAERAKVARLRAAVEGVLDSWHADEHDAAACQDFGCKDCVVVACDFDIRAALDGPMTLVDKAELADARAKVEAVERVLGDAEADDFGGIAAELIHDLRAALADPDPRRSDERDE